MPVTSPHFTLIAVASRDGFIVPPNGAPPRAWASPEEQLRFVETVVGLDWAFMGRRTHEQAWRPDRRRVVFTRSLRGPEWRHPRRLWVDPARLPLADIVQALEAVHPAGHCGILGGVEVHDWFAGRNLIDAVELTIEPQAFGGGVPLFSAAVGQEPAASLEARGLRLVDELRLNAAGTRLLRWVRAAPAQPCTA